MTSRVRVREVRLLERDVRLRMPFRFGVITLTEATEAYVSVRVELAGGGTIVREEGHAIARLTFAGNLPCPALAGAAAESRLGHLLGRVAGKVAGAAARQLVEGSVAVEVRIAADTRAMREKGGTPEDRAAILPAVRAELAAFATPAGIRLPARVIVYAAEA